MDFHMQRRRHSSMGSNCRFLLFSFDIKADLAADNGKVEVIIELNALRGFMNSSDQDVFRRTNDACEDDKNNVFYPRRSFFLLFVSMTRVEKLEIVARLLLKERMVANIFRVVF
jgi:hypothetical protein